MAKSNQAIILHPGGCGSTHIKMERTVILTWREICQSFTLSDQRLDSVSQLLGHMVPVRHRCHSVLAVVFVFSVKTCFGCLNFEEKKSEKKGRPSNLFSPSRWTENISVIYQNSAAFASQHRLLLVLLANTS